MTTLPDRTVPSDLSLVATCTKGAEDVLADELRHILGADCVTAVGRGAVSFRGSLEAAYRACLWSRVASRILLVIRTVPAGHAQALYRGITDIDWLVHLEPDATIAVDFVGVSQGITNSHFGALKVKDAIVDQVRHRTGRRPSVDLDRPDVRINVHLRDEQAAVSIDLSGLPLHRRGHGREGGIAPVKENLAAAILLLAGWRELASAGAPIVDPMCGSGTFLLEAGGIAMDRAPGLERKTWGFTWWAPHDPSLWKSLVDEATARADRCTVQPTLIGADSDPNMVLLTRQNAKRAGIDIRVRRQDLSDSWPPAEQREEPPRGLLVTNPPYGERLEDEEGAARIGIMLGQVLRRRYLGWFAVVLAGSRPLANGIGLKARKHVLFNGPIECRLLGIDINDTPVVGVGLPTS